jgi:hypothetical protein
MDYSLDGPKPRRDKRLRAIKPGEFNPNSAPPSTAVSRLPISRARVRPGTWRRSLRAPVSAEQTYGISTRRVLRPRRQHWLIWNKPVRSPAPGPPAAKPR